MWLTFCTESTSIYTLILQCVLGTCMAVCLCTLGGYTSLLQLNAVTALPSLPQSIQQPSPYLRILVLESWPGRCDSLRDQVTPLVYRSVIKTDEFINAKKVVSLTTNVYMWQLNLISELLQKSLCDCHGLCSLFFHLPFSSNLFPARFPLYYELKIAFVIWLLSPYTKGASLIYRKFLHPFLSSKERVRHVNYFYNSCFTDICWHMVYDVKFSEAIVVWKENLGFVTLYLNTVNMCGVFPPTTGNWWLYCTSKGKRLWDRGEFWTARLKLGSFCCCHCSSKGNFFIDLIYPMSH